MSQTPFRQAQDSWPSDELGRLHSELVTAQRQLAKQDAELVHLREDLARLVEARTAELERANEALRAELAERKRVEAELQATRDRLARTEAFSHVIATHVGLDGRWLKVPPTLAALLGYTEEELLAGRFEDVTHPDDFEADWSQCQRLIRGEIKSFDLEKRYIRKDRRIVWVDLNCSVVTDRAGTPVHFLTYIRDITARKRAQEALRESERFLASLVNHLPGVAYRCRNDRDWTMIYLSQGVVALTGHGVDAFLTNRSVSFGQLIDPEDQSRVWDEVQRALRERTAYQLVYRIRPATGPHKWVWEQGEGVYAPDGTLLFLEGFITDITAQRQTERELAEASQFQEHIIAGARVGIVVLDRALRLRVWNRFMEEMSGTPAREVLGKRPAEVFPRFTDHSLAPLLERALAGESIPAPDLPFIVPGSDRTVWVASSFSPLRGTQGETAGVIGIVRNITDRMRAIEALQESEVKYRTLIETTDTGYLIVDMEGRVLDANAEYVRLTGRKTFDEIRGRSVLEWTAAHDLQRNAEEVAKCGWTGRVRNLEIDYVDASGMVTPIEINARVIETEAGPRILSLCRDITDRKEAERRLLRSRDALERNRQELRTLAGQLISAQEEERRRIARDLHDDFNQRLASLAVKTEVLAESLPPSETAARRGLHSLYAELGRLSDDVHRMAYELHTSLLDDVGLEAALRELIAEFEQRTGIRAAFVARDVPKSVPSPLALNLYRIAQECLQNAAKHSRAPHVAVRLRGIRRGLSLVIGDTGIGFDAKALAERSRGLGLRSLRERAHLISGRLTLRSRRGSGTRVGVWVPLPGQNTA